MTQSTSPWLRPRARRIIAVAGVSTVVLAAIVAPSAATGSSSTSVTVASSVNGVVGAPAFSGETSTVALTLTNQSLRSLAGYIVVVPQGLGAVTSLGVSNANWQQKALSCGTVTNCSALYLVTPKTLSAFVPKLGSITSSFGITPPANGSAQFRILGIGSSYSGLTVVGSQPTITIVSGPATKLEVSVTPPVIAGTPQTVIVRSVREYPAGTFTARPFPGPLTFTASNGDELGYATPDVSGTTATVPVTFPNVQVSPKLTLTANSGANSGAITGDATFEVVAAGVVAPGAPGTPAKVVLTGAGGNSYAANLTNGSNGPVSFTEVPCSALPDATDCTNEVNLFGDFKDPITGLPLYSNEAPAGVDWTCDAEACPSTPRVYGSFDQDQVVDFQNYPVQVSLLKEGVYTEFAAAGPCNPIVTDPSQVVTGKITLQTAKDAGFCLDVYAISRADNSFGGALTLPVLFVEDPKLRGLG